MTHIATLQSQAGTSTSIELDRGRLNDLARAGKADAYIVATEDGFSPLGMERRFLANDLGISEDLIAKLAHWNRFENPRISLVAIPARRESSLLRGVILAPSETSKCYKQFAPPFYGRPYRDFYYNVTYEAIAYVSVEWSARRLAISHLSASQRFHESIAMCNAEALAHFCDANPRAIDSFTFLGCCMGEGDFAGIPRLNADGETGSHRAIDTEVELREGYSIVHLGWKRAE